MKNITRPTLLLDEQKCRENIRRMAAKASRHDLDFRPHFKTHQSAVIGEWFREEGVKKITVSSVKMAKYFALNGWKDITIAFPFNLLEMEEVNAFPVDVSLNLEVLDAVTTALIGSSTTRALGIWIEIDTGDHRTGLLPEDLSEIEDILAEIAAHPLLSFCGFLTHAGQTYTARDKDRVIHIHHASMKKLLALGNTLLNPHTAFSTGDSPSCSLAEDFTGISEIRPGNFVFYDIMQEHIGSCKAEDIALALACPVVAVHPEREEILIHGGAVHLSKEHMTDRHSKQVFGYLCELSIHGWGPPLPGAYVKSLSQEHGLVHVPAKIFHLFKPGMLIGILPVHACLTADAMGEYHSLDGDIVPMMQ